MPKFDLLPCPFCGKRDTAKCITVAECDCNDDPTEWDKTHYGVVCGAAILGGCGASTGWNHSTPEEAAKEWNTRASVWIPCDKKPPERITYLVTDGYCVYFGYYDVFENHWTTEEDTDGNSLLYWMFIPEPPKEVHHDEN